MYASRGVSITEEPPLLVIRPSTRSAPRHPPMPRPRVVLMSATFDTSIFVDYFTAASPSLSLGVRRQAGSGLNGAGGLWQLGGICQHG